MHSLQSFEAQPLAATSNQWHKPAHPSMAPLPPTPPPLQEFEKKEPRVKARAATNLAFLYALESETDMADKYADLALKSDRYNARAFVNKVRAPDYEVLKCCVGEVGS